MNNYKLKIQYDGTNYSGWQIQENSHTVQQEITDKMNTVLLVALLGESMSFREKEMHPDLWFNLKHDLEQRSIHVVDIDQELYPLWKENMDHIINKHGRHYTPEANLTIAEHLHAYVVSLEHDRE